jgi:multiple sugar transport system ATP-binding protein
MTLGQKIIVLKDGDIQQIADPTTLYKHPKNMFIAGFIGSPPMNFIAGKILHKKKQPVFQNGSVMVPLKPNYVTYRGRDVILGIRPSDFSLHHGIPISMTVDVVEPMGSEVYVYGRCDKISLSARLTIDDEYPRTGENVTLKINVNRIYLFDAKTEENIS